MISREEEAVDCNRREVLIGGGVVGGVLGLGTTGSLIALEEHPSQPGDTVGEAERQQRVKSLLERFGDEPVDMLNLLKFKAGGEESYARYGAAFARLIGKFAPGTEVVYGAKCESLLVGTQEWDQLFIVRYPSMAAFLALTTSQDYEDIAHLRTDALERTVLYAMAPAGLGGGN
jgi:uncharacterized protein (DUF1330 family)